MEAQEQAAGRVDQSLMRRAIAACAIGNATEWFDYSTYGFLAIILGSVFFPSEDPTISLLSSFAVFGVAFVIRPLGGLFFGHLGDKFGRGEPEALGVRLAIDDFGKGYSSLSYLKMLPVNVLKIDRSFVEGLGKDPRDTTTVEAMVSLAHSLGLEAVGEGVETAEQLEHLEAMGCELAQGFYLARPLPREEVEFLLADRSIS